MSETPPVYKPLRVLEETHLHCERLQTLVAANAPPPGLGALVERHRAKDGGFPLKNIVALAFDLLQARYDGKPMVDGDE